MEHSFTTLFKEPRPQLSAPRGEQEIEKKGIHIPRIFLPIYLPLLLLAAAIGVPLSYVFRLKQHFDERRFAKRMKTAGRSMTWPEFKQVLEKGEGTVIGEHLSIKGPFRLWWTPEDIPATSPHRCDRRKHLAWLDEDFIPFFEWCYSRFTHPRAGLARLVYVPQPERKELKATLTGVRFVSACSFRSIREAAHKRGT